MKVFVLTHEYSDADHDAGKFIGIFSTRELAEETLVEYQKLPGFRVWPDGFLIEEWEVDRSVEWKEGFSYPDPEVD